MSAPPDGDPVRVVAEPIARALDGLILVAAASFALSVATVVTAVLSPEGLLHEVAHFALIGVMGLVVLARVVRMVQGRSGPTTDVWTRARAVHRSDAHLAQILTVAVPTAWLAGSAAILVHHVPAVHGAALMMGVWLPAAAVLWILAGFAWHDLCRDRIAAALDESDRRYREYWQDLARP